MEKRRLTINFDSEYIESIIGGTKKTTIRKGIKKYWGIVSFTSNNTVFAEALIKNVVVKRLKNFDERDAVLDGFESLNELRSALRNIYGEVGEDDFFSIIYFELLD